MLSNEAEELATLNIVNEVSYGVIISTVNKLMIMNTRYVHWTVQFKG